MTNTYSKKELIEDLQRINEDWVAGEMVTLLFAGEEKDIWGMDTDLDL